MAYIRSLHLTAFRNYGEAALGELETGPVVLYGANGAGKTNVLEAVSLLSPGKGMRGAKATEMQRLFTTPHPNPLPGGEREYNLTPSPRGGEGWGLSAEALAKADEGQGWTISAEIETQYGPARIGTGLDPATEKRLVRINGAPAKGQAALSEYLSCVWLTPQMDRLFLDAASSRRRFLDRLVFAFDAGHSGRTARFENAMAQRSKILRENSRPDPAWLDGLERTIAETGTAIAAARLEFCARLQQACDTAGQKEDQLFPRARLRIGGTLEELLTRSPALEVEDMYRYQLRDSRKADALTGGSATGPHKSDLIVAYAAKDMPAAQCSTGEQKALLIGIVLAHSRLIAAEKGAPPILLLDEIAAHLDKNRRAGLYSLLSALGGQVWMTGTDRGLFDALAPYDPQMFAVDSGHIAPQRSKTARSAGNF